MTAAPRVRVAYGYVAGYGLSGRGYVVMDQGVRSTPTDVVYSSPAAAWSAYRDARRRQAAVNAQAALSGIGANR